MTVLSTDWSSSHLQMGTVTGAELDGGSWKPPTHSETSPVVNTVWSPDNNSPRSGSAAPG